jgi:hypothetical protein
MKTITNIFLCLFVSISLILSLAFIVIEGRLLFSGDWLIYNNPLNGFIRYLFRLLLALFVLIKGIIEFKNLNEYTNIQEYLFFSDLGLFLAAVVIYITSTNYVGVVILSIATLITVIKGVKFFAVTRI